MTVVPVEDPGDPQPVPAVVRVKWCGKAANGAVSAISQTYVQQDGESPSDFVERLLEDLSADLERNKPCNECNPPYPQQD